MTSSRSLVVHGHFYQPPREDPWTGRVPAQPSAAPYHDWNERIERECYGPVVAARVLDETGGVHRQVNLLEHMSFDFGPTLLRWLERAAPETYAAILAADRASVERTGFGNAMAMPYHHVILPLSTRRDKETEVRWGLADFRRRFGREPGGMWLPETAVDDETLDVLAAEGVRFTVLAPSQVAEAPADGLPGLYRTRSGRSIAVFVYDGPMSHDVAFGQLLRDGAAWAERIRSDLEGRGGEGPTLLSVATDGETYGHHHTFGEMALAAVVEDLAGRPGVRLESFASFLDRHPPVEAVALVDPSAWSCAHGVDRWRRECGCKLDPAAPTRQTWRATLRGAVEWLLSTVHAVFESGWEGTVGPWVARDRYGTVLDGPPDRRRALVASLSPDPDAAGRLLEMEREALASLTSCGWFFDDLAGIETVQVLRHAARAIELSGSHAPRLEAGLLALLSQARSNDPAAGSGDRIYRERALRAAGPRVPPVFGPATPAEAPSRMEPEVLATHPVGDEGASGDGFP